MIFNPFSMQKKITFPALVIGRLSVDKINYRYLVCDKRLIYKAFKDVLIIDSLGNVFDTLGIRKIGGVSFFYSAKLLGLIVKVEPILKRPVYEITSEDLKKILISLVDKSPKEFLNWPDQDALKKQINMSGSYQEIMSLF